MGHGQVSRFLLLSLLCISILSDFDFIAFYFIALLVGGAWDVYVALEASTHAISFISLFIIIIFTVLLTEAELEYSGDSNDSLRLTEVRIPNHIVRDSFARLECHYDLDGEALYSVKWYKDGNEFYRYVPRNMPPAHVFTLPGISIDSLYGLPTAL
uniref:Ig-like domain-containing protein n=1 Tax=Phlebotomus papatasi TaxID=29031 RepID=A0A1B0DBD3_PHLPP